MKSKADERNSDQGYTRNWTGTDNAGEWMPKRCRMLSKSVKRVGESLKNGRSAFFIPM